MRQYTIPVTNVLLRKIFFSSEIFQIRELEQAASSEDYGQDYEHLLVNLCRFFETGSIPSNQFTFYFNSQLLQNKFDDLKHRVESGAERFNQCSEFAKKLLASESPYTSEIEKSSIHMILFVFPLLFNRGIFTLQKKLVFLVREVGFFI